MTKLYLTLFILFLGTCSLGFGSERASDAECDALISGVASLLEAFPCARESCSANPTVPSTPSPPPTTPVATPSSSTQAPIIPSGDEIQVGTYIPNWFVYNKHYMGVEKLNVFGENVGTGALTSKYAFWATYLESLAPKLTHIYYAFWNLKDDCAIEDVDPDASWYGATEPAGWIPQIGRCNGLMNDMMSLKAQFPHLKLLLSLGGWTYSKNFSKCSATPEDREKMYKTFSFRVNQMDENWGKSTGAIWDGADFDWEFPAVPDGLFPDCDAENDWPNYIKSINHFRSRANGEGRTSAIFSAAIGVGNTLSVLAETPSITKAFCDSLDHLNLMEYDIHGKWDRTTGHNAPFCLDNRAGDVSSRLTVVGTINKLQNAGCPAGKMHIGIPNYSHAWTNIPAGQHGNGLFTQSSSEKWAGWSSFSDSDSLLVPQGIISWWDMKETQSRYPDFKVHSMDCPAEDGVVVPVKHIYSQTRGAWASYEDEETVSKKTEWARKRGLGGFFFWDAQQDKKGDLMEAGRQGFGNLPVVPASGPSNKCFDDRKIDFDLDPMTGMPYACRLTHRSLKVVRPIENCGSAGAAAKEICGNTPTYLGSRRDGTTACVRTCSMSWGAGPEYVWPNDILHFACEGDEV